MRARKIGKYNYEMEPVFSLNRLLLYLNKRLGLQHSDIIRMDFGERYEVMTSNRIIKIPMDKIRRRVLNKCRTYMDFKSELADISIGGAPPLKDWSTVIIRTEKGEELFNNALKKGSVRKMKIEEHEDVFENLLSTSIHKKIALREAKRLRAKGLSIPPADLDLMFLQRERSIMSSTRVEDVMTKEVMTVHSNTSVKQLLDIMMKHHHMGYPVVDDEGKLVVIVTFEDVMKVNKNERGKVKVEDIAKRKLIIVYPKDSLLDAFEKMSERKIGHLLIVDPENTKILRGVLTRTDIMHALRS